MIRFVILILLFTVSAKSFCVEAPDFILEGRIECFRNIPSDIRYIDNEASSSLNEEKLVEMSSRYDICASYFHGTEEEGMFTEVATRLSQLSVHASTELDSQVNDMSIENIKIQLLGLLDKLSEK